MIYTSEALQQLIEEFSQFPGIGRRTAQRLALYILKQPREEVVKMAKTLDRLLRVAKREARRRASPSLIRLKWVNTVCYLTQTYNSLLRNTDVDELKEEMTVLQEKLKKVTESRHQQPQTSTRKG